jgi:hypothetical protein
MEEIIFRMVSGEAMKDDVTNAVLFIKHNADKVQLLGGGHPANFSKAEKVKDKKENPNELISDLRHAEILRQLKGGLPNRPAWFSKTQIRKVGDLDVGGRIQVKFLETGASRNVAVWHTALIKSITKRLGENGRKLFRIAKWPRQYGITTAGCQKSVVDPKCSRCGWNAFPRPSDATSRSLRVV